MKLSSELDIKNLMEKIKTEGIKVVKYTKVKSNMKSVKQINSIKYKE